jgi:hypothetical protein
MIEARYPKKCPGCGDQIDEGDDIGMVEGEWVCEDCVDANEGEDR